MNWYISGGCGFIGLNLIKFILDNQLGNIRILDNFSVGKETDLSKITKFSYLYDKDFPKLFDNVELIEGDLRDYNLLERSLNNTDIVVHLAANTGVGPSSDTPIFDFENNIVLKPANEHIIPFFDWLKRCSNWRNKASHSRGSCSTSCFPLWSK